MSRSAVATAAALAVLLLAPGCGGAHPAHRRPVPPARAFFGIVSPEVLAAAPAARGRVLAKQASAGIGLLRQTFDWARIELAPGRYDFRDYDALVLAAANHGIAVLPTLFDPPRFRSSAPAGGAGRSTYPPRSPAQLAGFATVLVRRYGPRGSLWRDHPSAPRLPLRSWQVWNEPNLPAYWGGHPDPGGYAALLRATYIAIKRADPGAEVVTAGLPNSRLGVPFTSFVNAIYAAGARQYFDVLAIHPYAREVGGVLAGVTSARALMAGHGDATKAIWVTELGWASGGPPSPFTVSPARQAALIGAALGALAAARTRLGLRGVVYFDWRDARPYAGGNDFWGLHTGLLARNGAPKLAYRVFRTTVAAARGR